MMTKLTELKQCTLIWFYTHEYNKKQFVILKNCVFLLVFSFFVVYLTGGTSTNRG